MSIHKKAVVSFLFLLTGFLLGCFYCTTLENVHDVPHDYAGDYANYASLIQKDDCYLCSDNPSSNVLPHLGEENIGLINLNTFECYPFEVNRYSENKELIEKLERYGYSNGHRGDGETETTYSYTVNSHRGYLYADLYFNEHSDLQLKKMQNFLCSVCLENVMESYWSHERHWDMALIDFKDGKITPLSEHITGTNLNEFQIQMQYFPDADKMHIFAFYCPVRYSELDYDPDLSVTDEILYYCENNNIVFQLNNEVIGFLSDFEEIVQISYGDESVTFRNEPFFGSKELTIYKDGTYKIGEE